VAESPDPPPWRRSYDSNEPAEPSLLRHPLRLLGLAGAVAVVVGVLLPWVDYGVDAVHASTNGLGRDEWGILALVTAVGLAAVFASRSVAGSQARWVQLVPAILGLVSLAVYCDARLDAQQLADDYRASGYTVTLSTGLDLLLLGSIVCAVAGLAVSVMAWRAASAAAPRGHDRRRHRRGRPGLDRRLSGGRARDRAKGLGGSLLDDSPDALGRLLRRRRHRPAVASLRVTPIAMAVQALSAARRRSTAGRMPPWR
jgi:hypothetical protein